jgi:glycosyltransferase involved in cell wall biosynthesis
MRVLVLLTDLFDAVGGIQTFSRCLVKALDEIAERRGWTITLLVLNDRLHSQGDQRYFDPKRTGYHPCGRNKASFAISAVRHSVLASFVIIGHVNFVPLAVLVKSLKPHIHLALIVYGLEVWKRLTIMQRLGLQRTDRIWSISLYTRDQMVTLNRLDRMKFSILPCSLDPYYGVDCAIKTKERLTLPHGKMILSVARLEASEKKGIDLVLEALPKVAGEVPGIFFVVVGEGSDRERLEHQARTLGVHQRVIFTGRLPAGLLESYYAACDVFVLPSLLEGFGIVFLEAMYQRKPCVGVRAGAVPEVIEDQVTGLVTDPGDAQALAKALVRLLSNQSLASAMAKAGNDRLHRRFSFRHFSDRVEANLLDRP